MLNYRLQITSEFSNSLEALIFELNTAMFNSKSHDPNYQLIEQISVDLFIKKCMYYEANSISS